MGPLSSMTFDKISDKLLFAMKPTSITQCN
jgi:hypothetical protein